MLKIKTTYYWKQYDEELTSDEADKYREFPESFDGEVGERYGIVYYGKDGKYTHFKDHRSWATVQDLYAKMKQRKDKMPPFEFPFNKQHWDFQAA